MMQFAAVALKRISHRLTLPNTATRRRLFSAGSAAPNGRHQHQKQRKALVLGSSGALGSHVARYLSCNLDMQVLGADVSPELAPEWTGDWQLTDYCALTPAMAPSAQQQGGSCGGGSLGTLTQQLVHAVHAFTRDGSGLDAIVCASGGWQSDPPAVAAKPATDRELTLDEILEGAAAYADAVDCMRRKNLDPVVAAAYIAQHYMNRANATTTSTATDATHTAGEGGGLMVVIGATVALQPTPGMMAYGLSKAAAHFCVQTLGSCTGRSGLDGRAVRQAGRAVRQHLPSLDNLTVVGILPTTLDTAANRKLMGSDKTDQWTKPEHISREIGAWIQTPALRPHSGALVKVHPDATGKACFELVR